MSPLLTIAIPTYNPSPSLLKALESCLSQPESVPFEVLLVDNCSETFNHQAVSIFLSSPQLRYVRNDVHLSMYENHNRCLQLAKGNYILFLHDDDVLADSAICSIVSHLRTRGYPHSYIFWGHSLFRDFLYPLSLHGLSTGQVFAGQVAFSVFAHAGLTPSGTCFSIDIRDKGGFLVDKNQISSSDSSSLIYFALHGYKFEMIPDILFMRRFASTAISTAWPDIINSSSSAFAALRSKLDPNSWSLLVDSLLLHIFSAPFLFLIYLSRYYPSRVFKRLLLEPFIRPIGLVKPLYWIALSKSLTRGLTTKS